MIFNDYHTSISKSSSSSWKEDLPQTPFGRCFFFSANAPTGGENVGRSQREGDLLLRTARAHVAS